jgi:hypothetical protein
MADHLRDHCCMWDRHGHDGTALTESYCSYHYGHG